MDPYFKNRRIIWESKSKQVWVILGCFLFVASACWIRDRTSTLMFWTGIIFFGGGGLLMLVHLLNPKNRFVKHNSPKGKQISEYQFKQSLEDDGIFVYTETGFDVKAVTGVIHLKWADIETLFGYKEDLMTYDEICLDIFANPENIHLSESLPGWFVFIKKLSEEIPSISKNWDIEISTPAFATNLTLLYDKNGRKQGEAEKQCYKD